MNRLIIAGSPRVDGRTSSLAHDLFEACIEECPEDELAWVPVSEVVIDGCLGCGHCAQWAKQLMAGEFDELLEAGEDLPPRCSIDDDMIDVYELIDDADELTIVSPVYFSGPTSQLKAVLDRLQPYYCLNIAEGAGAGVDKRPAVLHVVGEGGDPHGFQPLVTIAQSALACAGFKLETVFDWVGKIDPEGEIQEEATVISLLDAEDFAAEGQYEEVEPEDFDSPRHPERSADATARHPERSADATSCHPERSADATARHPERSAEGAKSKDPSRPKLHLDDKQVIEQGRLSAEQGKRPGKSGKTEKRQTKGSAQTNNRNKRKENQGKRASDGRNTGPKAQGGRRSGGQGPSKGGKRRG